MTAEAVAVVTGGGSGIGRALVRRLAAAGIPVLAVGRRQGPLEETAAADPGRIRPVAADVGTPEGRAAVAEAVGASPVRFLVHNAAVLEPVAPLAQVGLAAWRAHMAVNVEGPLFLTQALLGRLGGGRVLHVSSGAAHRPVPGWGAYCTAKAALHMIWQVLREELAAAGVAVGSVRPGVVDTPMQAEIRRQPRARFPVVDHFVALHRRGALRPPEEAAELLFRLLVEVPPQAFSAAEWDLDRDGARLRGAGP
ncbi:SDR family NAD(P)-dependent oxidoreductase [Inmirania thermothiophila]|uniref:NADP-dependent 3-hydroxy acid dehydrogenase YdfG n=1 Tax=Inmirania thermothiophila TaxID=1750597 RepID=A0A3N1XSC4_9GAMM|nr:SDR family NAD(P)-dependent oxidoreductase [Inmirania thermothiophila]ROR29544.1 NADP-dependent 3-hydroxy acid dehydrogenase YdfG [Inmirania thermothiophila]